MTADAIAALLDLQPHPEGGFFRETFRAPLALDAGDGRTRAASTAIYFLLPRGTFSAWHRVRSDEVWHWYAGGALRLHQLTDRGHSETLVGGDLAAGQRPQAVVPAGVLQAAEPVDDWVLCGCTVAPGFDFADFELPDRDALLAVWPDHAAAITRFTRRP